MGRADSVAEQVDRIDGFRRETLWRDPDRPSREFVPVRQRQDPETVRAKARARTAAWRNQLDRKRAPEARDIGMSLVVALVTSANLNHAMTDAELEFVSVALADLVARGFDPEETKRVLRRLRNRLVDPGDRQGEESESTSAAISPTSWGERSTIF